MKATQIDSYYFEVVDGDKWYTARQMRNGLWFVTNHKGRALNQGTALHRRVVAALADAKPSPWLALQGVRYQCYECQRDRIGCTHPEPATPALRGTGEQPHD